MKKQEKRKWKRKDYSFAKFFNVAKAHRPIELYFDQNQGVMFWDSAKLGTYKRK